MHGVEETRRLVAGRVLSAREPAGGYAVIEIRTPEPVAAAAGQFAMIRVPCREGVFLHRPMSLMGAGETLELLVRRVGTGSNRIADLGPGDSVEMLVPLGRPFPEPSPDVPELMVGGGVGAAPLAMRAREAAGVGAPTAILYGGRSARDLVIADEMREWTEVIPVTEDGSAGIRGLATDPLEVQIEERTPGRVLACGPLPMMAAAAGVCRRLGVPCLVCLEALMACGFGACLGCAVPAAAGGYLYVCKDGPVMDGEGIDWAALRP